MGAGGTHVALLRGINVGRAKRVAMADLRALVEKLGYGDVRTLLNSGNVVFTMTRAGKGDAAADIERALAARLGVSARVVVLSAAEIDVVVADHPLRRVADNPSRLMVAVPLEAKPSQLTPLSKQDWAPEALAIGKRVAYLWCPGGIIESRLAKAVGRAFGDQITIRNWGTITKLHALTRARG